MAHTQRMSMASVSGAGEDIETKSELANPAQALIVQRFKDACFDTIQIDVAVNIVKNDFAKLFGHCTLFFGVFERKREWTRPWAWRWGIFGPWLKWTFFKSPVCWVCTTCLFCSRFAFMNSP